MEGEFVLINFNDANEKYAECDYQLKAFLHNENTYTNCMPDFLSEIASLKQVIVDRDCELKVLRDEFNVWLNREDMAKQVIEQRDRTIAILEENLDRARVDHLEQLRLIIQMLKPIKNNAFCADSNDYTIALKLVIAVIRNNIEKLDPNLS